MRWRDVILVMTAFHLGILSMVPIFPDPYYHKENVCFWVWAYRELIELKEGER